MNEEIIALLTKERQLRINGKMMTLPKGFYSVQGWN